MYRAEATPTDLYRCAERCRPGPEKADWTQPAVGSEPRRRCMRQDTFCSFGRGDHVWRADLAIVQSEDFSKENTAPSLIWPAQV